MKDIRWSNAAPPMPDHFKNAMTDTLGGLNDMKRRHKFTAAAAVALAAMLVLAGMACAAQYVLLDFIFTDSMPGDASGKAVHHVDASAKGKYMDFTVNDYIFDGVDLYADWTLQMHTDEPLILIATGLKTDFEWDTYSDQNIPGSIAVNNPLTSTLPNGAWSGMNQGHFYDFEPTAPFDVTVELALIRPDENALMLKAEEMGSYPSQPVWFGTDDVMTWSWGYYQTEHEAGSDNNEHAAALDARAAEVGYHEAWMEYFEEYGFGEVVERLSVEFTVIPESYSGNRLSKPETFRMDGYNMTVEKVEFTGFSGDIELSLAFDTPVNPVEGEAPTFTVYADGEKLDFAQQMEGPGTAWTKVVCDLWSQSGCALLPDVIEIESSTGEKVRVTLE